MGSEFDLKKVYTQILSKERIIEYIENAYDKEFIVSFLPRTKDNADILIRSLKLDCKEDAVLSGLQEKKKEVVKK